jgi:glutathione S-transferase
MFAFLQGGIRFRKTGFSQSCFSKEKVLHETIFFPRRMLALSPYRAARSGTQVRYRKSKPGGQKTETGADYYTINARGYVPALQLDSGDVLTEGPAIVQYLADKVPEKKLAPAAGSMERYRLAEWLNFISTEVHKSFSPLFKPTVPEETKQAARDLLAKRLGFVAQKLEGLDYLMGNQFTVADAYLFTVLNWAGHVKLDLSPWPVLKAYQQRVAARPAVHAAMVAEGLIKA